MKILQLIPSLNPDLGGVVATVQLTSEALRLAGNKVDIVSLDSPGSAWLADDAQDVIALGPAIGNYGYSSTLVGWLKSHAGEYDAVIVNGLWQYVGLAAWRALSGSSTPYFVFTHGMLDVWFKKKYPLKHLKKWLYWPWAEYRVLRDARRVIFTCEEERLLSRQSFWLYKAREEVAALGVPVPPSNEVELSGRFIAAFPMLRGKRLLLFISRIHPKKGCDMLIESFAKIAHMDERLHLVMAGPDQVGWGQELRRKAILLEIEDRITWTGMLTGDLKWGAFYAAEAFCLPSHQENFGMVVAEALACGKPVLISNKVQIWRDIVEDGAGLVGEDTLEGTLNVILKWHEMGADSMQTFRSNALSCYRKRYEVRVAAERLINLIQRSV